VYLVDTNIWLERLLDQAGSEEVGQFLQRVSNDRLYLSDFTLHSIGSTGKVQRAGLADRLAPEFAVTHHANLIREHRRRKAVRH